MAKRKQDRLLELCSARMRTQKLKLRADRADVILPASIVLHLIGSEAGVKQIMIPCRRERRDPFGYRGRPFEQHGSMAQGAGVGIGSGYGP